MAYSDDIDALNPVHAYSMDGDANDRIDTQHGTNSGGVFTSTGICEDATNCYETNSTADRITLPSVTAINGTQTRKAVGGWFMPTATQNPPKVIYYEGGTTTSFKVLLGWGNNLMFEVDDTTYTLQVFGDTPLVSGRAYYLTAVFEGNGYGNEFRCYLDGIEQLGAEPTDRQPDSASIVSRTQAVFGVPSTGSSVGGVTVTQLSPINGRYNEWALWDGADAILTDTEIREELFEKGALADATVTNQTQLDALADTLRPNVPLCIRVDVAGSISLTADNITFDPLASIHVQYTGTGTLTWTNTNGSNASIGSTTSTGSIAFENPATFTIDGTINGAEIRIYDDEVADVNDFDTELSGTESNTGTSYQYAHSGTTNTVVVQHMASGYVEIVERFTLGSTDQTLTLFPIVETN